VSISTGGAIISGARYDGLEAAMVDMETYAVFRAAQAFGIPMVGLRGISDGRNELSKLPDWTAYLGEIDAKLAAAVEAFVADVGAGRFRL
jgi:adenosylhomocysteine nucleosidase